MLNTTLRAALLAGAMLVPGVAAAATAAIVTTDLNVRTGPGSAYQRFDTIPAGSRVDVLGCIAGYNWCDISWGGDRGWVSGDYLAYREGGDYYNRPMTSVGISIGVPVVGFDAYSYHDRYYRGRSWYNDRYLDRPGYRPAPREVRREYREDRRDWRQDARDDRRDWRRDGRDDRREYRQDRRDDRRDDRVDRRDDRRDNPREVRRDDRPQQQARPNRSEREALREIRREWPGFNQ